MFWKIKSKYGILTHSQQVSGIVIWETGTERFEVHSLIANSWPGWNCLRAGNSIPHRRFLLCLHAAPSLPHSPFGIGLCQPWTLLQFTAESSFHCCHRTSSSPPWQEYCNSNPTVREGRKASKTNAVEKLSIVCSLRKSCLRLQREFPGVYDHWFGNGTIRSPHDFASAHMPYLWNAQRINVGSQGALEETSVVYHGSAEVFWGWQMLFQKVNKMKKALPAGP